MTLKITIIICVSPTWVRLSGKRILGAYFFFNDKSNTIKVSWTGQDLACCNIPIKDHSLNFQMVQQLLFYLSKLFNYILLKTHSFVYTVYIFKETY